MSTPAATEFGSTSAVASPVGVTSQFVAGRTVVDVVLVEEGEMVDDVVVRRLVPTRSA
ncbi:MAG: hypothetical protein LC749_17845 [Actinobacteria bacterium]|nr:hypothetical protein [Actinomycetota bacterium]